MVNRLCKYWSRYEKKFKKKKNDIRLNLTAEKLLPRITTKTSILVKTFENKIILRNNTDNWILTLMLQYFKAPSDNEITGLL